MSISMSALLVALLVGQGGSIASSLQKGEEDKIQSGEAGYRVGCAAARTIGINNVCGEHYEIPKEQAQEQERRRREYERRSSDRKISPNSLPEKSDGIGTSTAPPDPDRPD